MNDQSCHTSNLFLETETYPILKTHTHTHEVHIEKHGPFKRYQTSSVIPLGFPIGSNRRPHRHPSELRGFYRQCEDPENQWLEDDMSLLHPRKLTAGTQ